jgi:hypothetical protein
LKYERKFYVEENIVDDSLLKRMIYFNHKFLKEFQEDFSSKNGLIYEHEAVDKFISEKDLEID